MGFVRVSAIIAALLLGMGFFSTLSPLGLLFFLVFVYLICMDKIDDRISGSKAAKKKEPEELIEYDPSEYGEPIACPYCGKEIPEDVNYCFYCGRSISEYKRIEAVRVGSLTQIDSSLAGLDDGPEKERIQEIRDLVDKILLKYEQNTDDRDNYEKFTDNYLPKTVAAIKEYNVLRSLDNLDSGEKKIQNLTDKFCKEIDNIAAAKEKEIMEI